MYFDRIKITDEIREKAYVKKQHSLEIFDRQWRSGYDSDLDVNDSWYTGGLGEVLFETKYPEAEFAGKSGYDHLIRNLKSDMKISRRKSMWPNEHAFILIPKSEVDRGIDKFVFGWVVGPVYDETWGWLLGWMDCQWFRDVARLRIKGETQDETNFIYRVDSYEIRIWEMNEMESLFDV